MWVLLQVRAGIKSVGVNGDILKQALENSGVAVLASDETDMTGATVATSTGEGDVEGEGEGEEEGEVEVEGEDFAAVEAAAAAGTESTPVVDVKSVPHPVATIQSVTNPSNSTSVMLMAVRDTATGTVRRHVLRKVICDGISYL